MAGRKPSLCAPRMPPLCWYDCVAERATDHSCLIEQKETVDIIYHVVLYFDHGVKKQIEWSGSTLVYRGRSTSTNHRVCHRNDCYNGLYPGIVGSDRQTSGDQQGSD